MAGLKYRSQPELVKDVAIAMNQAFSNPTGPLCQKSIEEALTSAMAANNVRFTETVGRK